MNICVFCASSDGIDEVYFEAAQALGKEIARRSWKLVFGGTNCGLMKAVASATLENGGTAKGIIPQCIEKRGVAAQHLTELIVAVDMKERKQMLRDFADAFIALPGGWGTLEEITEVITLKQLGIHHKPIVFINTNGFYNSFFEFIGKVAQNGFISPVYQGLYVLLDDAESAIDYIEKYKAENVQSKYEVKNS